MHTDSTVGPVLLALVATLAVSACSSTAPVAPAKLPATPAAFKETDRRWATIQPAEAQPRGTWWKTFGDPQLDELVERANGSNTSIQAAAARLDQARAFARATSSASSVQAGLNNGINRQGGPLINAAGTDGTLLTSSISLSYEADLFGRISKATDAALRDAQAREALLQSTRLLVQAETAQTYFSLRALDAEHAIMRLAVADQMQMLNLTERRFASGLAPELDVARVRAELAATRSDLQAIERRRAELEHALAVLVGEVASSFNITQSEWTAHLPSIPPGIPSTVLARRPDVSAAQRSMLAAQSRLGVAKAAWFPTVSLTAGGGYASPELSDLFKMSAQAWVVGALFALPLFDGGKRDAGIKNASAELEAMVAAYREQILVAFRDVEDQLSSLRILADQSQTQETAVDAASRATVLSESRFRSGLASQLEVLDAHRTELRNQRQSLQLRSARYQSTVALVRALGGSW